MSLLASNALMARSDLDPSCRGWSRLPHELYGDASTTIPYRVVLDGETAVARRTPAALVAGYLHVNKELLALLEYELCRESGLSGADYQVLAQLSEARGGLLRARELGSEIGWHRSRLSHHLDRMEGRGLVVREECSEDARGLMVRLTKAGRRAIEEAAPAHVEAVQLYFFDQLSKDEIEALAEVFDRVRENLRRAKASTREDVAGRR
jgi:DNA-binding MarR family transcriptional regulator